MGIGCSFAGGVFADAFSMKPEGSDLLKKARKRILDIGCYALRVDSDGKISVSVDAAEFALGYQRDEEGKFTTKVGFSSVTPLDRHDWFLSKFTDSGWAPLVKDHLEAVIKDREEDARKKREKDQEKKRKAKEKEGRAPEAPQVEDVPDLPVE
jgi:hypothetical protein